MNNQIGVHHHFKFERKLLQKPGYFSEIVFEQLPFFKLYPKEQLRTLRDVIDVLSCAEMPHAYQRIIGPLSKIEGNHYKDELIPVKYCVYNRQSFFVRAYQLRHKNLVKVEIIIHSETLGRGKYYSLKKAIRSAIAFFNRIEENLVDLSLNLHLKEYFLPEELKKVVGAFELELIELRKATYPSTKKFLIERMKNDLLTFEESAKEKAKNFREGENLSISFIPTHLFEADLFQLISPFRDALTFIIHSNSE